MSGRDRIALSVAGLAAAALIGVVVTIQSAADPVAATFAADAPSLPLADVGLADATVERVRLFRAGHTGSRLTLRGPELSSVLQHAAPGLVPTGVLRPTVDVIEGRIVVKADVVMSDLPGSSRLSRFVGSLRDTVYIEVTGRLIDVPGGALTYHVDEAQAGRVPLPTSAIEGVLEAIAVGAPRGAIAVPWPAGIGAVRVLDDRVVIDRFERILDREVDGSDGL